MSSVNIRVEEIAYGLFGDFFRGRREKYEKLRTNLLKARMFVSVDKWLSKAVFYSIVAALGAVAGYIIMRWFISLLLQSALSLGITDLVLSIVFAAIAFFVTFLSFYIFPRIRAWERRRKIDELLPYAIGYISAMAVVGVFPYEIFKKLSAAEETYGDVSKEAKLIVRDVELLGVDFITALKTLVAVTPSEHMRSFVQPVWVFASSRRYRLKIRFKPCATCSATILTIWPVRAGCWQ